MIEFRKIGDGKIELVVKGKIEKADIDTAIKELEAAIPRGGKLNVLADLSEFSGMTAEAFFADLRYGLTHLSALDNYDKMAVVTDADWIEAMVWIEDKVLRDIDMRCFEPDDRDQALVFINGGEPAEKTFEPGIMHLPASRDDIVAFEITERIRDADAKAMFAILADAYARHDKIDLVVIVDDFEGFDPKMIFEGSVWSGKMKAMSHVRRYALVGGPSWMRNSAAFFGSFLPFEVKSFEKGDESSAFAWVEEERA